MKQIYYTPESFNDSIYKKTGWTVSLIRSKFDNNKLRLIVRVATGRKYWPLFSILPNFELGVDDMALSEIKNSLLKYTHPMIDRFIIELNDCLTDIYKINIDISKIESKLLLNKNYYSTIKI